MDKLREFVIQKKGERAAGILSLCIIAGALLLCIGVSALGFVQTEAAIKSSVQTAARMGEKSLFNGYVQMKDPLLVLVNDDILLPQDWKVTPRMVHDEMVDIRMSDALIDMFEAAEKEEIWFWVASGYRSEEEQKSILSCAIEENKENGLSSTQAFEKALRTIAKPGHSEHHTGLAVDLNDVSDHFEDTAAYQWLVKHGAQYGFIQRYRGDKAAITGIDNESWHYRYVGKKHAEEMQRLDMCLEEYVLYLQKQGEK